MSVDAIVQRLGTYSSEGMLIAEASPDDPTDLTFRWCNPAFLEISGYDVSDIIGQSPAALVGPESDTAALARFDAGVAAGRGVRDTVLAYRRDRSTYWMDLSLTPVWPDGGAGKTPAPYWLGIQRVVDDRVALEQELARAVADVERERRQLWEAIDALPYALILFDADDRMVTCNENHRRFYGSLSNLLQPGVLFETLLRAGLADGWYADATGREEEWLTERLDRFGTGQGPFLQKQGDDTYWQVHDVRLSSGYTVGVRVDVTDLKRQQRQLEEQASAVINAMHRAETAAQTDALTGLGNRRGLDLQLSALAKRKPARGHRRALLQVDLDRFKQINDMFGHKAGDHVLKHVAGILRASVRPGDYIARAGGDEFAIVIEAENAMAVAEGIAERVIAACRVPVLYEDKPCHYGATIGIAQSPPSGAIEGLMENADIALYEAKENGRNRALNFSAALRRAAEDKKRLADDLLSALEVDTQIVPWFQPQVCARDGSVAGVEALVRWFHPKRGLLQPPDFLSIAEDLDVLAEIDARILRQSLDTMRWLADQGFAVPKVAVNVSYRRLVRADLGAELARMGPLPCRVAVELLETINFDAEGAKVLWMIDTLREQGFEIEVDDFGSGHASVTSLLKLRPDRVKIDRQLVKGVSPEGGEGTQLVRAIIDMVRSLGVKATAEGVESAEQGKLLNGLGCDTLQGFYFSPPLGRDELAQWLSERRARAA